MTHAISSKLIGVLILLTAVPLMTLNMFIPSLSVMAADYHVGYDTMALAVSGYLLFTAAVQIIVGPLADKFGRRPVLLVCLGLFVLASTGCALSQTFPLFLTFRILQGAVISGAVLSRAIVSDLVPPGQAVKILGYISMAMSLAPIVGPTFGGILGEFLGWRSNFWFYVGSGCALWVLVYALLPETMMKKPGDRSSLISSYKPLLTNLHFWVYALIMGLAVGGFFIFITGVPLVAVQQLGMNQFEIGLGIGSITVGFMIGSFLASRLASRFDLDWMIRAGRIVACAGLLTSLSLVWWGWISPWSLFAGTILVGVGNGVTMPGANTAVMFVHKDRAATASGLSGAVIVVFGAAFSAATGAILHALPSVFVLLSLMLAPTIMSLVLAFWVAKLRK